MYEPRTVSYAGGAFHPAIASFIKTERYSLVDHMTNFDKKGKFGVRPLLVAYMNLDSFGTENSFTNIWRQKVSPLPSSAHFVHSLSCSIFSLSILVSPFFVPLHKLNQFPQLLHVAKEYKGDLVFAMADEEQFADHLGSLDLEFDGSAVRIGLYDQDGYR